MSSPRKIEKTQLELISESLTNPAQAVTAMRYQVAPVVLNIDEKPESIESIDVKAVAKRPYIETTAKKEDETLSSLSPTLTVLDKPTKQINEDQKVIDKKKLILWAGVALVVVILVFVAFKNLKK